ncbi:hypothetical protein EDB83DRAFT_2578207 [Lactarius deliciosus]|nr:hypothetical protein EDB83DRAFT_2578207 [Lactarius deliciosus]
MTDIIVKIMVEVLSILGIVTKEIGQGRTKKYLKKLIGRKEVEDALQRLDALTQEEARMAAAEALVITRGIDDKVKDVDDKVEGVDERVQVVGVKVNSIDDKVRTVDNKVQRVDHKIGSVIQDHESLTSFIGNELRKDLRTWIAPPDPSVNYNTASGAHHEGTAAWCTKGITLADWKTSGSLLWIHGKPTYPITARSILSSVIIRDIKSVSNAGSALLAYFYFDFKDTTKQGSRALLSSLLVQLSDQSDVFCDALFSLYSAHKRGSEQPTVESLAECLKGMLAMMGQVPIYLIMDALDESPNDSGIPSSREKALELVKELVELHHPNIRLCVTSRPEFDIRTVLESLATQQISLHNESGQRQDINHYVTSVVRSDKKMKRWRDEDKNMVIEELTKKADGMFRWAFCQLEVLRHCFPTNLRRILEELPKSLDETYKRILKEINNANREHAYRLLQCLAVASRPLRVEELAEVLAFDYSTGGIPKLIADWHWEDREEAVLSACSSLVSVVVNNGSRVVQFSHFSVKEFLISDRLSTCVEEVSRFHIAIESSHVILAQACLGVLLNLDDHIDKDSTEKIPLVQYASAYWDAHAKVENVELQIKDAIEYFFDVSKPHFSAWVRMQRRHDLLTDSGSPVLLSAAPLYFAAERGFCGLVEHLITKYPQPVNNLGGRHGTPLHASMLEGHIEVSQVLFAHGADINSRSAYNLTPLHLASREGRLEAGKWLLNHSAEVNAQALDGRTPLHLAAAAGHVGVSKILLECNAEVNARDDAGDTPLLVASCQWAGYGYPGVVRLLLNHSADAQVRNNKGKTPLHCAAVNGYLNVTQLLLESNVEVNARDKDGCTPFVCALANYNTSVFPFLRLLLGHKCGRACPLQERKHPAALRCISRSP